MSNQDQGAVQQDDQHSIDQEAQDGEQMAVQEQGRPGGQDGDSQDTQGTLSDQQSPQEAMGREEPQVQQQDEGITLPQGSREQGDPTSDHLDQETPASMPADQPDREAVPIILETPGSAGEPPLRQQGSLSSLEAGSMPLA